MSILPITKPRKFTITTRVTFEKVEEFECLTTGEANAHCRLIKNATKSNVSGAISTDGIINSPVEVEVKWSESVDKN